MRKNQKDWCENTLFCAGPAEQIAALKAFMGAKGDPLCFARIKPLPEKLKDGSVKGIQRARWRILHWGCALGADHVQVDLDEPTRLQMRFSTPLAPPRGIARAVREWASQHAADLSLSWRHTATSVARAGSI